MISPVLPSRKSYIWSAQQPYNFKTQFRTLVRAPAHSSAHNSPTVPYSLSKVSLQSFKNYILTHTNHKKRHTPKRTAHKNHSFSFSFSAVSFDVTSSFFIFKSKLALINNKNMEIIITHTYFFSANRSKKSFL